MTDDAIGCVFVDFALANNCVDTGDEPHARVPHPPDSRLDSRPNEDSEDGELKDMRAVRTIVAKMTSRCNEDVLIVGTLEVTLDSAPAAGQTTRSR